MAAIKPLNTLSSLGPLPLIGYESAPDECNENRADRIAEAAYFKAQARGFEPGHEMEDWFAAKEENQ